MPSLHYNQYEIAFYGTKENHPELYNTLASGDQEAIDAAVLFAAWQALGNVSLNADRFKLEIEDNDYEIDADAFDYRVMAVRTDDAPRIDAVGVPIELNLLLTDFVREGNASVEPVGLIVEAAVHSGDGDFAEIRDLDPAQRFAWLFAKAQKVAEPYICPRDWPYGDWIAWHTEFDDYLGKTRLKVQYTRH